MFSGHLSSVHVNEDFTVKALRNKNRHRERETDQTGSVLVIDHCGELLVVHH